MRQNYTKQNATLRLMIGLVSSLCMLLLSSCGGDDRSKLEVSLIQDFVLPPTVNTIETFYIPVNNVPNLLAANLAANNIDTSEIEEILPSYGRLMPKFDNISLGYIESVGVYYVAPNALNNRREMFYLDYVDPNEDTQIGMIPTISNLTDGMKSNSLMGLELKVKFRSFIPSNTVLRLQYGYYVFYKKE